MAGKVLQAPPDSDWQAGNRVIAMTPPHAGSGAWAEIVAAPTTIDLGAAAALPLAGSTALRALAVQPGEKVLVTGAVGGFAAQMLVAAGCEVTGLH